MTTAVSVDELQRAWAAVAAGEFRTNDTHARRHRPGLRWEPAEPVVVVAGAAGRVGASTVAVAMATAATGRARVIECAPMYATGLADATTAELGITDTGWRQGNRDQVLIERTSGHCQHLGDIPVPGRADCQLTVIDASWDVAHICNGDSWLRATIEMVPLIIVTVATVPGLRALDNTLRLTGRPEHTWCVVTGPRHKRWPKPLQRRTTAAIGAACEAGRLFTVPNISSFAISGIAGDPLPARLLTACRPLVEQTVDHMKGTDPHVRI